MLHELIDFGLFLGSLPLHGQHELFHPGDIGLGYRLGIFTAQLLASDINNAVTIVE